MVLKLHSLRAENAKRFENDVKMYGTQTLNNIEYSSSKFENDVKMYGTQTRGNTQYGKHQFENDVKMYGTQTIVFHAQV